MARGLSVSSTYIPSYMHMATVPMLCEEDILTKLFNNCLVSTHEINNYLSTVPHDVRIHLGLPE